MSLRSLLEDLRPALAEAAQAVVDEWEQDDDGVDEEFGSGGACDAVAQAMAGVLGAIDTMEGGQDGDDHAYLIAYDDRDAFVVDIPPGVYERGDGYSWRKIPGIQITEDDVVIERINRSDIEPEMEQNPSMRRNATATRYVGRCGVCEGDFKLTHSSKSPSVDSPGFVLVHHGYKRPGDGAIHGDCFAVGMVPLEISTAPTEQYLALVDQQLADHQRHLEQLESGEIRELRKQVGRGTWGAPLEFKVLTPADGWAFKDELRSRISATKYRIQNLNREAARLETLVQNWVRRPVRTIEEEAEKMRAVRDVRQAQLQAARDVRQAKRDAISQKNAEREQEKLDLMNEYREIFNRLAFDGSKDAKAQAMVHWGKMQRRKNKKSYLNFIEPDLEIDQTLLALDLAAPNKRPHGKWQYVYANEFGWVPHQ